MSVERQIGGLERRASHHAVSPVPLPAAINVIEFATDVLGIHLYPRQATVLKLMACATDLLTDFDLAVIAQWSQGYRLVEDGDSCGFTGTSGTVPGIVERIEECRLAGRWFPLEINLVLGRRASKSTLCAIVALWQIFRLIALDDPQAHLHMPPGKRLGIAVYSTSLENASRDLFGELRDRVKHSPMLSRYRARLDSKAISFYTPAQLRDGARERKETGSLVISPSPTTGNSSRGPALVGLIIDEAAYLDGAGSTADASTIYGAATPALGEFVHESLIAMVSTPATMVGGFYERHHAACAAEARTGALHNPESFMLHLPSWALYEDFERAHLIPMWPGGPRFAPLERARITPDSPVVASMRRSDNATYLVEYEAQWAAVRDAYFPAETIARMFAAYGDPPLTMVTKPDRRHQYFMHLDPSSTGSNTALVIGHVELVNGDVHLVIDLILTWRPADEPDGQIRYTPIIAEVVDLINRFQPVSVTVDPYSGHLLAELINAELINRYPTGLMRVVSANQSEKLTRYEKLKLLAGEDRVHIPPCPDARNELLFLQRTGNHISHPSSGPVQTDDIADALAWIAEAAIASRPHQLRQLARTGPRGTNLPWEPSPYAGAFTDAGKPSHDTGYNPARGIRRGPT